MIFLGAGLTHAKKSHMKILIVDDSMLVYERVREMLSPFSEIEIAGHATTPGEALDLVRERTPDVVVLDIRLSGGSGIDVLRNLKADHPSPVVIMLTNYSYPQYRKKCLEEGADFFLEKSADFGQLPGIFRQMSQSG